MWCLPWFKSISLQNKLIAHLRTTLHLHFNSQLNVSRCSRKGKKKQTIPSSLITDTDLIRHKIQKEVWNKLTRIFMEKCEINYWSSCRCSASLELLYQNVSGGQATVLSSPAFKHCLQNVMHMLPSEALCSAIHTARLDVRAIFASTCHHPGIPWSTRPFV